LKNNLLISNIYSIFAAVHFILINYMAFYRCNGNINLLKIQFMFEMQTIFLAKLTLVVGLWQYVACKNCKLMFLMIVLLLFCRWNYFLHYYWWY